MPDKKCLVCKSIYTIKLCRYEKSKFCSRTCHDNGRKHKDTKSKEKKRKCIELRKKMMSCSDIAKHLGLKRSTVEYYLRGYPLPKKYKYIISGAKLRCKSLKDAKGKYLIKKLLIEEKGHFCWNCKRKKWLKKPIYLQIDHIDGNKKNNELSNLRILCPNCHAQTDTYGHKNWPKNLEYRSRGLIKKGGVAISSFAWNHKLGCYYIRNLMNMAK